MSKHSNDFTRRTLCVALSLLMALGCLPMQALALPEDEPTEEVALDSTSDNAADGLGETPLDDEPCAAEVTGDSEDSPAEDEDIAAIEELPTAETGDQAFDDAPTKRTSEADQAPEELSGSDAVELLVQDDDYRPDMSLCDYVFKESALWDGEPVRPNIIVKYEGKRLKEGVDYTLTCENNNAPDQWATARYTGIGDYSGEYEVPFYIPAKALNVCEVKPIPPQKWTGKVPHPKPVVTYGGRLLTEGVDYTLDWEAYEDLEFGGLVNIRGIGEFATSEGSEIYATFDIYGALSLDDAVITWPGDQRWTGKPLKPKVTVKYKGKTLKEGTDYTVSYSNNINTNDAAETSDERAQIRVKGIGMYYKEECGSFTIVGTYLNASMVKPIPVQKWTGKQVKPKLTLTYKGKTLKEGVDFTVTYINNVKPCTVDCYKGITGMATAILQGKGGFSGDLWVEFSIAAGPGTWKKTNGKWWYKYASGGYPRNTIVYIDGKMYLFDRNGYLLTGWHELNHRWYYAGSSGALAVGWKKLGGKWYFFDRMTGRMAQWLVEDAGKLYLCDFKTGEMRTGWGKVDGKWYYFESSGVAVSGWKKLGGAWYYFNPKTYVMQKGWKKIDGKHYYFDSSGAMVSSKWVGNYYLQADGSMATNKWIGNYYVGADGKWVKGKTR